MYSTEPEIFRKNFFHCFNIHSYFSDSGSGKHFHASGMHAIDFSHKITLRKVFLKNFYLTIKDTERSFWYATSMFLVVLAPPLTNFYAVFFKLQLNNGRISVDKNFRNPLILTLSKITLKFSKSIFFTLTKCQKFNFCMKIQSFSPSNTCKKPYIKII